MNTGRRPATVSVFSVILTSFSRQTLSKRSVDLTLSTFFYSKTSNNPRICNGKLCRSEIVEKKRFLQAFASFELLYEIYLKKNKNISYTSV